MFSINILEAEKVELMDRLRPLQEGNAKPVDEEHRADLERESAKWRVVEGRRRRIREEMWRVVREMLPEGQDEADLRVSAERLDAWQVVATADNL